MRAIVLAVTLLVPAAAHAEWQASCAYRSHAGDYHWQGPSRNTKTAAQRDADKHAAKESAPSPRRRTGHQRHARYRRHARLIGSARPVAPMPLGASPEHVQSYA